MHSLRGEYSVENKNAPITFGTFILREFRLYLTGEETTADQRNAGLFALMIMIATNMTQHV